jgi:hypothetical protein
MNKNLFILISVLAGIFSGVISNLIYDILKYVGVLPNSPNLKRFAILFFILLTSLVFMAVLPNIINPEIPVENPEKVASDQTIACMQQHGMNQAKETIVVDDWETQKVFRRLFKRCDWPPPPYADPDGFHVIVVDTVPGPEYFSDLSNAEMTAPLAERIHSKCQVLKIGYLFTNAGTGGPLQPFEIIAGGIHGGAGDEWSNSDLGFSLERDETVLLHRFAESLDLVECVQ